MAAGSHLLEIVGGANSHTAAKHLGKMREIDSHRECHIGYRGTGMSQQLNRLFDPIRDEKLSERNAVYALKMRLN